MKKLLGLLLLLLAPISPAKANVPCSLTFTLTNGSTADATQVMANYNAIIACLGNAAAAGANADITSLSGLTTPLAPSVGGTNVFIASAMTGGNTIVVPATTPNGFQLVQGWTVIGLPATANSAGAVTLQVGSLTAKTVLKKSGGGLTALTPGDLIGGTTQLAVFTYDGTQFELMDPMTDQGGANGPCTIASAATTDLASTGCHNITVTGTATITNLGNTLVGATNFPRYIVKLAGATIAPNSTSCATVGGCIFTPGGSSYVTTAAGDYIILQYVGQGSNGGAAAGNWNFEQASRGLTGIERLNPAANPQVFNSSGTYTPTPGLLLADVECWGAGGAGGGASATAANQGAVGSGGTGGGYSRGLFTVSAIGVSQTVTIGTGGSGVSGGNGNSGGNTTFGALLSANGGSGGLNSGTQTGASGVGSTNGTAGSGGYISMAGSAGGGALVSAPNGSFSGAGGPGAFGMGAGASAGCPTPSSGVAGANATAIAAGGGGACNAQSQAARTGGSGGGGACIIHEYVN